MNIVLRLIKDFVKFVLRSVARCRLRCFPLTDSAALWWARAIMNWPAIISEDQICLRKRMDLDITMDVGLVDAIERELWLRGEWDRTVKTALIKFLKPGDAFLDLGANIGYFTLLASRLVGPTGTVIAVEPSIRAPRKLTHHLWLNRCSNVLLLSCAAGDELRCVTLGLANESNIGGSALLASGEVSHRTEPVLLASIGELLDSTDLRLRLVKLDLEGFELSALRGCRRLIERFRPVIVCEVTEKLLQKYGHSAAELVRFFSELNYELQLLNLGETSFDAMELSDAGRQFDVLFVPRESLQMTVGAA